MKMIKETVKVKMPDDYKEKAYKILNDTISDVLKRKNVKLSEYDKRKIKNLSLDQININISQRSKSKSMWVFDTENHVPASFKTEKKLKNAEKHSSANPDKKYFLMKNNLSWTYQSTNEKAEESMNKKEFEDLVLQNLLEDFETAAFYGTLSYMEE